jgi:hypothetical protein
MISRMQTFGLLTLCLAGLGLVFSCSSEDPDREKPVIDLSPEWVFPGNCDTLYYGEPFHLKMRFHDNQELGSWSMEIHHNFDQHAHTTEISLCPMDQKKTAVNPLGMIRDFTIPTGLTVYDTDVELILEDAGQAGLYETGDYHLVIRLTDKTGWSTFRGLGVKMQRR